MRFRVQRREKKENIIELRGLGFKEQKRREKSKKEETRKIKFTYLTIYFYVCF
jgi:hypothetical protein